MKNKIFCYCVCAMFLLGCGDSDTPEPQTPAQEEIISENFLGFGTQMGGYDDLQKVTGSATLSNEDWDVMYQRLRFLRPALVRIMGSEGWNYSVNGVYNPQKSKDILFKILEFCQAENIQVIWGEWGHTSGNTINEAWLGRSLDFLEYLTTNYPCVKYFTMVNEPNGEWSSTAGSYELWRQLIIKTTQSMEKRGLMEKVQLLAPDVTISRNAFTGVSPVTHTFISNASNQMARVIGVYDLHLYPGNDQVENDKFYKSVLAYKKLLPKNKDAIISEIGFSYFPDSPKGQLAAELLAADPHADTGSSMLVYESIYGIDMSAALIQLMMAGYKGALVWRLDDAMYMNVAGTTVKANRWGFWNSLGKEAFDSADDENLRPWFFTTSLLSRNFPQGATILGVTIPKKDGLYAVACKKDGKYTIALVNTAAQNQSFTLALPGEGFSASLKQYKYVALERRNYIGERDENGFPKPFQTENVDLSNGKSCSLEMEASSFLLLTNME